MFKKAETSTYKQLIQGVHLTNYVHSQRTMLVRFRLEAGAVIPTHQHPHEQTGFMLSGHMQFDIDGEQFDTQPGDMWSIPANIPHSATVFEEAIVIEVFSPPREDYLPS